MHTRFIQLEFNGKIHGRIQRFCFNCSFSHFLKYRLFNNFQLRTSTKTESCDLVMIPISRTIRSLSTLVRERLITLNLFDSRSTDPERVRRQVLSTRLFIVLTGLSICILLIYTSQTEQTRTIILAFPTAAHYQRLQIQYPDTLYCPCQTLSIPYQTYFKILPTFHQVCSSDFLSQPWIDFTFDLHDMFLWPMDVRTSLSAFWQLMKALCQSATAAVNDELEKLKNSPMISSAVLPEALLRARAQANLDTVFRKASNAFIQSIQLTLRITLSNGFITGFSTNFVIMERYAESAVSFPVDIWAIIYIGRDVIGRLNLCYCHYDESCPLPGRVYLYNNYSIDYLYTLNTIIPNATLSGLVVDCVPIQMTLASSLECFYNQACLDMLLAAYPRYMHVSKLDEVLPSRFLQTTRLEHIINELFVEEIANETVFDSYYHQCAPSFCTYTWSSKFDWIYVFTTLIALFGGLNVGLRLLTPYVVDSALYLRKKMLGNNEVQQNESERKTSLNNVYLLSSLCGSIL